MAERMNKALGRLVVALVLAALSPLAAALPAAGQMAPDFALKRESGSNLRLSELRGQVVLINFWASWCAPCRTEMPHFNRLYAKFHAAGFTLLGISVDEKPNDARAMAQKLNIGFPVLFDVTLDSSAYDYSKFHVARLYGVNRMPTTVIIDRNGRVRYAYGGYVSGNEEEYEKRIWELLKE
jgi:peroxiredoxin